MRIRDIMTTGVDRVEPNSTIREAARIVRDANHGSVPVVEDRRLIGMVTDRDIVVRAVATGRANGTTAVRDVMSESVCRCREEDVERAANLMAEHQVRRVPVVDGDENLVGIVALADLARNDGEASLAALEDVSEPSDQSRRA